MPKRKYPVAYKAKYTIEIEFTDKPYPNDIPDKELENIFDVRFERDLKGEVAELDPEIIARFDYVEKHFPNAVLDLYFRMLWLEAMITEQHSSDQERQIIRKGIIEVTSGLERHRVQRVIPAGIGRIKDAKRSDFVEQRRKFIAEVKSKLKILRKNANKTSLAKALFPLSQNGLRDLRRSSEKYKIDIEKMIKEVTKN